MMKSKLSVLAIALFFSFGSPLRATDPYTLTQDRAQEATLNELTMEMGDIFNDFNEISDEEYRQRLDALSSEMAFRLDPMIKERILLRVERSRSSTEAILGKAEIYFPIFEEFLSKHEVPHLIKYLAIIESNLQPLARSHAGAGGLWQFIPSTGRMYNMQISATVDDRSDTYKASESAAKLLAHLKNYHGDWCLALASYNCGAGRVNKAIKLAGSNDYWKVRAFLPTETQKYVPYFMAMVYVGEYAAMHDLTPTPQHKDLYLTDTIVITESTTLAKIAQESGIHLDTVRFLNPAYLKSYVPRSATGNIIVLPARAVAEMRNYTTQWEFLNSFMTENPLRAVRRIQGAEDIARLAKAFRCSIKELYEWNALPADYQPQRGDLIGIRKFVRHTQSDNSLLMLNSTTARPSRARQETLNLPTLQVVAIQDQKAITVASNETKKSSTTANSAKNVATAPVVAPANTKPQVAPAPVVATATVNQRPKAETAPTVQQGDVNTNRERSRNLRSNEAPTTPSSEVATVAPSAVSSSETPRSVQAATPSKAEASLVAPTLKGEENAVQKMDENADTRSRARNLRTAEVVANNTNTAETVTPTPVASSNSNNFGGKDKINYHEVKPQETLADIVQKYPHTNSAEIMLLNQLTHSSSLHAGMLLKIPKQ